MFCTVEVAADPLLAVLPGARSGAPRLGGVILKRKLGEGGAGRVYLGLHTRLDIPVAVKVLKSLRPEFLESFAREARITASLDHPNLVRVFDHDSALCGDGTVHPYTVMEYVQGSTAHELLNASIGEGRRGLAIEAALEIAHACAQALAAAHERGIIHRDVKPSNILVRARDRQAKLADLGIARPWWTEPRAAPAEATAAPVAGLVTGTPGYMSPETLAGGAVGPAADIYALGVTLYVLATGCMPHGTLDDDHADRQLTLAPPDPRTHVPDLDADVAALALACLERDPARRPADARRVAKALGELLARHQVRGPAGERAPATTPSSVAVPPRAKPVVLVVDDDDLALDLTRHVLTRGGYEPVTFADARRALEEAPRLDPDVAVVDLGLPDMDGLELFRRMRETDGLRDVPVLVVSAQSGEERIAEAERLGVTDYLVKPVDGEELLIRVQLLARLRAVARERERIEREYRSRKERVAGGGPAPAAPGTIRSGATSPAIPGASSIHGKLPGGTAAARPAAAIPSGPELLDPGTARVAPAPLKARDTVLLPGPDCKPLCVQPTSGLPARAGGSAPGRAVLVVDDDEDARALLGLALARAGHVVAEARDGAEALACIADRRPDLVLLDMVMPGLDGVEVCRRIRSGPHGTSLPIIVTASMDPAAIRRALEAGATDYLLKPVDPTQLACRVHAALKVSGAAEAVHVLGETLAALF